MKKDKPYFFGLHRLVNLTCYILNEVKLRKIVEDYPDKN